MRVASLEKLALALLLLLGEEHSLDSLVEDGLEVVTVLCRALEVADGLDLLGQSITHLWGNGSLPARLELINGCGIRPQIDLGADQNLRDIGAEVNHLGIPLIGCQQRRRTSNETSTNLGLNVLVGSRVDNREANEEDIGVGVREGTKTIVLYNRHQNGELHRHNNSTLLTSSVPKTKLNVLVTGSDVHNVVVWVSMLAGTQQGRNEPNTVGI